MKKLIKIISRKVEIYFVKILFFTKIPLSSELNK